jgi:hypothetical protein
LKGNDLLASLDVPKSTSHVTRRSDDLIVVDEATAREVASVTGQLARDANVALACFERIDRADVVEATAGDERTRRCIGACHHLIHFINYIISFTHTLFLSLYIKSLVHYTIKSLYFTNHARQSTAYISSYRIYTPLPNRMLIKIDL